MKYVVTLIVFVSFSFALHAQSNINPQKNYSQKRYLDSLRKTFKEPAIQISPQPLLAFNMPVAPLKNEGEEVGMSGEGFVYRMKTDNMLILKPETKTTYIPNGATGKKFLIPPARKKP